MLSNFIVYGIIVLILIYFSIIIIIIKSRIDVKRAFDKSVANVAELETAINELKDKGLDSSKVEKIYFDVKNKLDIEIKPSSLGKKVKFFNKKDKAIIAAFPVVIVILLASYGLGVFEIPAEVTPSGAPLGAIMFQEDYEVSGKYYGSIVSLDSTVKLSDVQVVIMDDSIAMTNVATLGESIELVVGGNLTLTFIDLNGNEKLDSSDSFQIQNGAPGDIIRLVFIPTGGTIAEYTL